MDKRQDYKARLKLNTDLLAYKRKELAHHKKMVKNLKDEIENHEQVEKIFKSMILEDT